MPLSQLPIKWIGSPHHGYSGEGSHGRNNFKPIAIVLHIAQGQCAGIDGWFNNPQSYSSTHYSICTDGAIHQYVAEEDAAYGNGVISKPDMSVSWIREMVVGRAINANKLTISIEHAGFSGVPLTPIQVASSVLLVHDIAFRWNIPITREFIVGHNQLDGVNRAACPGPLHPWAKYFEDLPVEDDDVFDHDKVKQWLVEQEWLAKQLLKKDSNGRSALAPGEIEAISAQIDDRVQLINANLGL